MSKNFLFSLHFILMILSFVINTRDINPSFLVIKCFIVFLEEPNNKIIRNFQINTKKNCILREVIELEKIKTKNFKIYFYLPILKFFFIFFQNFLFRSIFFGKNRPRVKNLDPSRLSLGLQKLCFGADCLVRY